MESHKLKHLSAISIISDSEMFDHPMIKNKIPFIIKAYLDSYQTIKSTQGLMCSLSLCVSLVSTV